MKLFSVLIALISINLCVAQTWEQTISFPGTPRDDGTHFKIGNKHFVGTGREVGFGCTRDFYAFDESTLNWCNVASLPSGKERQYASAVSWNGKGYLFGGVDCSGNYLNDFWCYDPLSNSWTSLNPLPASGRGGMVEFVIQDTLYIIGGRNANGILNEVWCYSFNDQSWSQKNALPSYGIWRGIAFTYQEMGYIGLGKNNLNNQTGFNADFLSYQSTTDTWSIVPNLNLGEKTYVGNAQNDSLLFLFGGVTPSNQLLTTTERLHLSDFTLDILPDFTGVARKGGCAFLVQNDLYYTTGVSTDTRFNETWRLANITDLAELSGIELNIYPNPTSTDLTIICNELIESILITDMLGRKVSGMVVNDTHFRVDTGLLPTSSYFISVKTANQTATKTLVVMH
jgi:N-acetylneuraminic acid mutarotase